MPGPGVALGELLTTQLGTDPPFGPCRFGPADYSCVVVSAEQAAATGHVLDAATELLWALSGRQFGQCDVTLRPCRRDCSDTTDGRLGASGMWPHPAKIDGEWLNLVCGSCGAACTCGPVEQIVLPNSVTHVAEVAIDGDTLDPAAWRLDNRRILVRQDGGRWPTCQHLGRAAGEPGTFTVKAFYGRELPAVGRLSLGELVAEFAKACVGASCAVPGNWATIATQGLTVTAKKAFAANANDLDTIPEESLPFTRAFLRAYNPRKLTARSRVYSPDVARARRTF